MSDSVIANSNSLNASQASEPRGTITIDASGSSGMDLEAFLRGGFLADAGVIGGIGMPVFDNGGQFSGAEMLMGYGSTSTSKYVLAHGDLEYRFDTHTVAGTINTIEYGTRGTGSYDSNGYFVGGNALLRITGLDLYNPVPSNSTEEAEIESTGEVHNFAIGHMYGPDGDQGRQNLFADQLDQYAQHFIGSTGDDVYVGTRFNDTIEGRGGNDIIDGGLGDDTIIFAGASSGYTITNNANGSVAILDTASGATTLLHNVEFARFDTSIIDLSEGTETVTGEAPTDIGLSSSSVKETAAVGTQVAKLTAIDADSDIFTYALVNDAGGAFKIVGDSLQVAKGLDYETAKSHVIKIKVTDDRGNTFEKQFTIGVQDVNEAPAGPALSKSTIVEDAKVGTTIGLLSATDPEGDKITYSLSSNPGGIFKIVDNKLQLAKAVDYETVKSHAITVMAKDSAGNSISKALTIKVTDVDEAPTAVLLSKTSVSENSKAGTTVGTLSAKDPEGGEVFYSLPSNPGGIFKLSGNSLQLAKSVDYETAKSHSVTVLVTDLGGNTTSKSFTIGVQDVNEAPTSPSLSAASVKENVAVGTTVGTLSAKDPEGKALTYTLTDNAGGLFKLSGNRLVTAKAIDYEAVKSGKVTVEVSDGVNKVAKSFTIAIQDVDDIDKAPTSLSLSKSTVKENVKTGTTVGTFLAKDPEGKALTYTLTDNAGGLFKLSGNRLVTAKAIDYEKVQKDTVTVAASDGVNTVAKTFTIKIADVVETIAGTSKAETLKGGLGADLIKGNGGNDRLYGQAGNDQLKGGAGDDLLIGGKGADRLDGGAGNDTASYQGAGKGVTASLSKPSLNTNDARGDVYVSIENLTGTSHADRLTGDGKANVLSGGAGKDVLKGNSGDDTLIGGKGADDLYGGKGADTFVFKSLTELASSKAKTDTIFDFSQKQKDLIDLTGIDAMTTKSGNQAFSFVGTEKFSKTAGELRTAKEKADTYVYGDVNGDGKADFVIHIDSLVNLKEGDFLL